MKFWANERGQLIEDRFSKQVLLGVRIRMLVFLVGQRLIIGIYIVTENVVRSNDLRPEYVRSIMT